MAPGDCVGLVSSDNRAQVPLKSVSTDVTIQGFVARVEATLTYHNNEDNCMEVTYVFPMDDGSAVYKLIADINGKKIVAECQEKQQARETYQHAVSAGHSAMLLEEDDTAGDIFKCMLGNLPPKSEAVLQFAYISELSVAVDGSLKFLLPSVLNPRYTPADKAAAKASQVPYVSSMHLSYSMDFKAKIITEDRILKVTSEQDTLQTHMKMDESRNIMEVKLAKPFVCDHDLSLNIYYLNIHKPCVIREKGTQEEGSGNFFKTNVLMVNMYPEFGESAAFENGEFIFVIDRSGSMHGDRMNSAKQALLYFLKSLPVGCYFNIISFGSSYSCLFPGGSECYAEESLAKALQLQESMDAYMGGTEILLPLQYVYSNSCILGHSRQIFLLTDGGVSNAAEVIALVRAHAHDTRVFTVGIGSGASTSLVRGVARAGCGHAEFVAGSSKLQEKVVQLLKKSMQPSITDLQLDLPPGLTAVLTVPSQNPVVYSGERCIQYVFTEGEVEEGQTTSRRAKLTGRIGTECYQQDVDIDWCDQCTEDNLDYFVHRMALKAYIKELEIIADSQWERKRDIIAASIAANIVSKFTAFVGVDKEMNKPVSGGQSLVSRRVPVSSKSISTKGTGGKGLVIGGARRHRKVLRDSVQGIQKGNFQRLQKRAAVLRSSASMHEETRGIIRGFVANVIKDSIQYTECSLRKRLAVPHVTAALKGQGRTIYPCFERSGGHSSRGGRGAHSRGGSGARSRGGRCARSHRGSVARSPECQMETSEMPQEVRCRYEGRRFDTRRRACVLGKGLYPESESEEDERSRSTTTGKISKTSTVAMISMQNFDGSWSLNCQLASALAIRLEKLKSESPVKCWGT
ncbi:von Willebrand factor A domain-containing protein 5A-like isoform X2 [Haliotis asinina]|uniref:von Willebrand factor A domain-containing protein 5A-like isoform X2 n=1 Tax=Haliotis asinina TaxID=109174 RepID=UPI003531FA98